MQTRHLCPPAGAVDCHAHVFGPFARFPLAEGRGYTPREATFEDYKAMLRRVGFDRAVLVQGSPHGTDHAALLDALARDRVNLRGIAVVDPNITQGELERFARAGVRGIRMSDTLRLGTPLALLEPFAERLRPLGWHVQVLLRHCDDLVALAPRIRTLGIPVLIDHMASVMPRDGLGAPGFRLLVELLSSSDHVWVKVASFYRRSTTGHPYADMGVYARALADARPDRVVFGSNWPHPDRMDAPPDDAELLDVLAGWCPDPALQHRILVENPERLFGFAPFNPPSRPTT
jgi:predicted TIM-barrel fold metal-dependent hydrolase